MKLPIACMDCASEKKGAISVSDFAHVAFKDDGRYELTCLKNHKSIIILQQQKFELLFDIGAYALTDGYYREAVSSFTSSLERFYEFFIKAALFEKNVNDGATDDAWKLVARQSERQLGAFIFLYTYDFGKPPPVLKEKEVQFRNDVVHRGKIPSLDEALTYGQIILDLVRPALREAKEKYPKGTQRTIFEHIKQNRRDPKERAASMTIPTIISLNIDDEAWHNRPLRKAITELRRVK